MNLRNKKKEKDAITQVMLLIDESGSMQSCTNATISGINEQIQELQKHTADVKTFVTLVTFSGTVVDRLENVDINELEELTTESYQPSGSTALFDAVAHTVLREEQRKYETKDVSRLLIIVTDGEENASQEFSAFNGGQAKVAEMLERVQKEGWTVTYLGANQDLTKVSKDLGLKASNVAMYTASASGTKTAFESMTRGLTGYMTKRKSVSSPDMLGQTLSANFYNDSEAIVNASLDTSDDESTES